MNPYKAEKALAIADTLAKRITEMTIYQSDASCVACTAMNILDGLDHHTHWDMLQEAWEDMGGFIEFCKWIAEMAEESERLLKLRNPQDFPGVYDYEVSYELGLNIKLHVAQTGKLPSDDAWKHWLETLADDFFAQGESRTP
jgi:hypothetical protein